jgi:hypothetical protein
MGLFSYAMNKAAQPVLGKFSIKVSISMTISNSVPFQKPLFEQKGPKQVP